MMRGADAERAAELHLIQSGLRIVARNWRCRRGELDIVAQDGATLVFVEVRQRLHQEFGGAAASIGAAKRAKLVAAAQAYLQNLPSVPPCRFDAICFESGRLVWLKNCIETD